MLLYLIIFLISLNIISGIGINPNNVGKFYIYGIPSSDIALLISLVIFILYFSQIRKFVNWKILFLFSLFLLIYLIIGLIKLDSSKFNFLNSDIRNFLWIYGGIGIGVLFKNLKKKITFLLIYLTYFGFLIIISSIQYKYLLTLSGNLHERLAHPNIYISSGLLSAPLILYFFLRQKNILNFLYSILIVSIHFYFVSYLGATRSMFLISLSYLLVFVLSEIVDKPFGNYIRLNKKIIFYLVFFMGITPFFFTEQLEKLKENRIISELKIDKVLSDPRFYEVKDFFDQSTIDELLIGKGFGGTIRSSIYEGKPTLTMHIGIMNIWLKFGLIPFVSILIFIIFTVLKILTFYFYSFKRNVIVNYYKLPKIAFSLCLLPWIITFFISGGYSENDFMMIGFVWLLSSFNRKNVINYYNNYK